MFAAIVNLTIDPARAPAAAAAFTNEILPRVKSAEGFVGGYWLDPVDGEGFGFVLSRRRTSASFDASMSSWSAPGVAIRNVDIRRVALAIP